VWYVYSMYDVRYVYMCIGKRKWIVILISIVLSILKDFSGSQEVKYTVKW